MTDNLILTNGAEQGHDDEDEDEEEDHELPEWLVDYS